MEKQIKLTEITGYELSASTDERSSAVFGYYKEQNAAFVDAKGAGWYGSDGTVDPIKLYTDGETIYQLKVAGNGKFKDEEKNYKEKTTAAIKSKLTADEIKFLGL